MCILGGGWQRSSALGSREGVHGERAHVRLVGQKESAGCSIVTENAHCSPATLSPKLPACLPVRPGFHHHALPHAWHTIPYQTTENGIIFASHLSGHASATMRAVVMLASSINSSTSWLASFCGLGIRHTRAGREVIGRTQREAKDYCRIEAPMRWPHCMRA